MDITQITHCVLSACVCLRILPIPWKMPGSPDRGSPGGPDEVNHSDHWSGFSTVQYQRGQVEDIYSGDRRGQSRRIDNIQCLFT